MRLTEMIKKYLKNEYKYRFDRSETKSILTASLRESLVELESRIEHARVSAWNKYNITTKRADLLHHDYEKLSNEVKSEYKHSVSDLITLKTKVRDIRTTLDTILQANRKRVFDLLAEWAKYIESFLNSDGYEILLNDLCKFIKQQERTEWIQWLLEKYNATELTANILRAAINDNAHSTIYKQKINGIIKNIVLLRNAYLNEDDPKTVLEKEHTISQFYTILKLGYVIDTFTLNKSYWDVDSTLYKILIDIGIRFGVMAASEGEYVDEDHMILFHKIRSSVNIENARWSERRVIVSTIKKEAIERWKGGERWSAAKMAQILCEKHNPKMAEIRDALKEEGKIITDHKRYADLNPKKVAKLLRPIRAEILQFAPLIKNGSSG